MEPICAKKISQCQNALKKLGFCKVITQLPNDLLVQVKNKNYEEIDQIIKTLLSPNGYLFNILKEHCEVKSIEHIISLREACNDWEEDGIWHDDGSRILAFSLSLNQVQPGGGILEFRKKGQLDSLKISTPNYGEMIIFKTGIDDFEHKINQVTSGSRLIIAGWCYPDSTFL